MCVFGPLVKFRLRMLARGKYKGYPYAEVAQNDRSYCAWVLRDGGRGFSAFAAFLRDAHGGVVTFGKHKGLFFDEVLRLHPDYCAWVLSLNEPCKSISEFRCYINRATLKRKRPDPGSMSPLPPLQRQRSNPCQCNICYDRIADQAAIPCGHVVCSSCAKKLRAVCPFCRMRVEQFLQLFLN